MRIKFPLFILAALMLTVPLWAQDGSKGTITGTAHDMSANTGTICGTCHIPHQDAGVNRTLLWNHATTTTTAYTAYSSATLNATITPLNQADTSQQTGVAFYSLACMSCHDGVTATNVVYRVPAEATTSVSSGSFWAIGTATSLATDTTIGTDLSNDHPVNFVYDSALATADGGLFNPTTPNAAGVGYVRAKTIGTTGQVTVPILFNNTVQCATCHNPHNDTTMPYLRSTNTSSALCLQCHSTT